MMLFAVARVFKSPNNSVNADFHGSGSIATPGAVDSHFGDLLFNPRFTVLVRVSELKHEVTDTAAKPVMPMTVI